MSICPKWRQSMNDDDDIAGGCGRKWSWEPKEVLRSGNNDY